MGRPAGRLWLQGIGSSGRLKRRKRGKKKGKQEERPYGGRLVLFAICRQVASYTMKKPVSQSPTTSQGGRKSRVPASSFRRSGNPKVMRSSLEPVGSKPGLVKLKTLKLILVTSWPGARHY